MTPDDQKCCIQRSEKIMGVSGINQSYCGAQAFKYANNAKQSVNTVSGTSSQNDGTIPQELIDYFFESPAQRIVDNWLRAHNITKEQFNAMSPEQQESLRKQMADEIKKNTEDRAKERSGSNLDIVA